MKMDKINFATLISYIQMLVKQQLDRSEIEYIDDLIYIEAPTKPAFNDQDILYKLLKNGCATPDQMQDAATWIKRLHA